MASIYKRKNSPFYWLKWHNPQTDKVECFSSEIRIGTQADKARVIQLKNEYALKESSAASVVRKHPFASWVQDYLDTTHRNSPKTLIRYTSTWRLLASYLDSIDVTAPVQIKREHCLGYLAWRSEVPHLNGRKKVCHNTMLGELKVLSKIMHEAVTRTYIEFNPCSRLGIKRDPSRIKEEFTDEQVQIVLQEIKRRADKAITPKEKRNAEYLRVSFEIARLQGIRLNETYFPLSNINFHHGILTVIGKGRKREEIPINPNLLPLLKKLHAKGMTHTYDKPTMPSLLWFKLFSRLRELHQGFENVSFHSTRVTVISRAERAGVPENIMMKTVLHSSVTVHRVYRRVKASELAPYWNSIGQASNSSD